MSSNWTTFPESVQNCVPWHLKKNPIWPPRLHELNNMAITPSVVVYIYIHLDSMTIGIVRGARGPGPFSISKKNPIWIHEIFKLTVAPSVFVIEI